MAKGSSQQSQQGGGYTGQYSGSTGTQPYLREFGSGFNQLSARQASLGNAPTAQMNGAAPAYKASSGFSPLTQYGLSQGIQNIRAGANSANANLATQLGQAGTGDNSALLAGLQHQNQAGTAGAMNALIPQAYAQQNAQDLQTNQGNLNSYLAGVQGTGANNQANLQSYLGSLSGIGQGQNLLNSVLGAGQLAAGNVSGGLTGFDTAGLGKTKSSFK